MESLCFSPRRKWGYLSIFTTCFLLFHLGTNVGMFGWEVNAHITCAMFGTCIKYPSIIHVETHDFAHFLLCSHNRREDDKRSSSQRRGNNFCSGWRWGYERERYGIVSSRQFPLYNFVSPEETKLPVLSNEDLSSWTHYTYIPFVLSPQYIRSNEVCNLNFVASNREPRFHILSLQFFSKQEYSNQEAKRIANACRVVCWSGTTILLLLKAGCCHQ